jgi:hypothetical protein
MHIEKQMLKYTSEKQSVAIKTCSQKDDGSELSASFTVSFCIACVVLGEYLISQLSGPTLFFKILL